MTYSATQNEIFILNVFRPKLKKKEYFKYLDFSTIIKKDLAAHRNSLHVSKSGSIDHPSRESAEEKVSIIMEIPEELNYNDPISN